MLSGGANAQLSIFLFPRILSPPPYSVCYRWSSCFERNAVTGPARVTEVPRDHDPAIPGVYDVSTSPIPTALDRVYLLG